MSLVFFSEPSCQLPNFAALIVNSTDTTVYFMLYDGDPHAQDAHGTKVEVPARQSIEASAKKFIVISKEYAHVKELYRTGSLLNYALEAYGRYRIEFDNDKKEWFVVQARADSSQ